MEQVPIIGGSTTETISINPRNIIGYSGNVDGYTELLYYSELNGGKPINLVLGITKEEFDAIVLASNTITILYADVLNATTGALTATSYNENYIVSLRDLAATIAGIPSVPVVELTYSMGSLGNKKILISGTVDALVRAIPSYMVPQVNSDWNAVSGVAKILNKPRSMPASDVYSWAKNATKPAYTSTEVGAEPAFLKNTGFNKDFGTTAGTVLEGRVFGTIAGYAYTDFIFASPGSVQNANIWLSGTGKFTDYLELSGNVYPSINITAGATFPVFSFINTTQLAQWNIELGRSASGNLEFWNSGTKLSFTPAGQIQSIIATGTAPFAVASTTLNTNLNADLLDGQHGSYYQSTLINPITGTGTSGYIPKFTGTGAIGNSLMYDDGTSVYVNGKIQSSSSFALGTSTDGSTGQFATDGTNNYLDFLGNLYFRSGFSSKVTFLNGGFVGIGITNPLYPLDVNGIINADGGYKIAGVSTLLDWSRTGYAGTAGQYLKSQGTGTTPVWTNFPSIPTATSGTYTPTSTNVTNITSSTPNSSSYTRVGDIVTVFGIITITNTLAVVSEVDITLPVASALSNANELSGTGTMDSTASVNLYIKGDTVNDRASIYFTSAGVGQTSTIYYSFQYKVL